MVDKIFDFSITYLNQASLFNAIEGPCNFNEKKVYSFQLKMLITTADYDKYEPRNEIKYRIDAVYSSKEIRPEIGAIYKLPEGALIYSPFSNSNVHYHVKTKVSVSDEETILIGESVARLSVSLNSLSYTIRYLIKDKEFHTPYFSDHKTHYYQQDPKTHIINDTSKSDEADFAIVWCSNEVMSKQRLFEISNMVKARSIVWKQLNEPIMIDTSLFIRAACGHYLLINPYKVIPKVDTTPQAKAI